MHAITVIQHSPGRGQTQFRDLAIIDTPFTKIRTIRHSGMFLAGIQLLYWMPAKNMLE